VPPIIADPAYPLIFILNDVPVGIVIDAKVAATPPGPMLETEPLAKVVAPTVIVKLTLLDPAESSFGRFEKSLAHAKARKTNFTVSGGR
jgi:hypothetical protein